MPLALIQNFPGLNDPSAAQSWSFNHWTDHQLIFTGIQNTYGVNLEQFVIDPITYNTTEALNNWLSVHQQLHDDFNSILGYPGNDLQDVDFKNPQQRQIWSFLHFLEHQNAGQQLGLFT